MGPSIVPKLAIDPVFTAFPVCALINFGVVEPGTRTVAMTRPAGREAQPRRVWRTACACDCPVPRRRGSAPRDCASSIANRCLLKYVQIGGDVLLAMEWSRTHGRGEAFGVAIFL